MHAFSVADSKNNISFWDIPILFGDSTELLVNEADRKEDQRDSHSRDTIVTYNETYLREEEQKRSAGLLRVKRELLPLLYARGSFYEVGFKIGRTFSTLIHDYIESHPLVQLNLELYETPKGKEVYNSCYDAVSRLYPEYMRELKGTAEGSKVPFYKLFLMHMEDIMLIALPPEKKKPCPLVGSTTVIATDANCQLMGHVVDNSPLALGNMYVVNATITECCPEQEFTALCIGGMLPGNTMATNSHGLAFVVNPVQIRKCNECGIPRSIVCRAALSAPDLGKLEHILRSQGAGVGNGMALLATISTIRLMYRKFNCYELGPRFPAHTETSMTVHVVTPPKTTSYFHTNKFHHLNTVQENINKLHVDWVLSKVNTLKNHGGENLGSTMHRVLGSTKGSPGLRSIYTSVETSGIVSVAVGIIDFINDTWSLWFDNPTETNPVIVMPLMMKDTVVSTQLTL